MENSVYVSSSQTVSVKIAMLSSPLIGAYSNVHIKLVKTTEINTVAHHIFSSSLLLNSTLFQVINEPTIKVIISQVKLTYTFHLDANLLSIQGKSCCKDLSVSNEAVQLLATGRERSVPSPIRPFCNLDYYNPKT